jgi:hypothetical protein
LFNSGLLTSGEWVYLVGLFQTAREHEDCVSGPQTVPMVEKPRPADCLDPMGCLWKHVPTSPEIGLYLCSRSGCPHTTSAGSAHSRPEL